MASGDIKAGGAFVELGLVQTAFDKAFRGIGKRLDQFGAKVRNIGAGLDAAGAALSAPLVAATRTFADFGDQIQKTSVRTGLGAKAVSELAFAAERSGTNLQAVASSVFRMNTAIGQAQSGSSETARAFEELGLSATDLGKLDVDKRFGAIVGALNNVSDSARRTYLSTQVFGRGVKQLEPLLAAGESGIQDLRKQARALGLSMDQETAEKAAVLADAMGTLSEVFRDIQVEIGSALAPTISTIADKLSQAGAFVSDFIQRNQQLVTAAAGLAAGLIAAGAAVAAIGIGIQLAGVAMGALATVIGVVLSPAGLLVGALAGGAVAFVKFTKAGQDASAFLTGTFSDAWQGIRDAIAGGSLALAGQIALTGLKVVWLRGLLGLQEIWYGFTVTIRNVWDAAVTAIAQTFTKLLEIVGQAIEGVGALTGIASLQETGRGLRETGTGATQILAEDRDRRRRQREDEVGARLNALRQRIQETQTTFEQLNQQAAASAEAARMMGEAQAEAAEETAQVVAQLPEAVAETGQTLTAQTRSSRAAALLGVASSSGVEKNTARTNVLLESIDRKIDADGGGLAVI